MNKGVGRIFRRGKYFWACYWRHGVEYRESTKQTTEAAAGRWLRDKFESFGRGAQPGAGEERITYEMLRASLVNDYKAKRNRSLKELEQVRFKHLDPFFYGLRAVDIDTGRVREYRTVRQEEGAADASVNREVAALRRMFKLAQQDGVLSRIPYFPMVAEDNVRQGFVEYADFLAIRERLPERLKDPALFLYLTGWRLRAMTALEWRSVSLATRTLRMEREHAKNKKPVELPLSGELLAIIERAYAQRRLDCQLVFHDQGVPLGKFNKAWNTACRAAGQAGVTPHDLCRSAIRNMNLAGMPEKAIMERSNRRTRSILDRYNIAPHDASHNERLDAFLAAQSKAPKVRKIPAVGNIQSADDPAENCPGFVPVRKRNGTNGT